MAKKLVSFIIPCYNEEKNIMELYRRITSLFQGELDDYNYEIIYVDNFSTDGSIKVFRQLCEDDNNVRVILMSRNFGSSQPSLMAGMRFCRGDCAVLLDGDIQDPPEVVPSLMERWKDGYEVVYGVRTKRKGSIPRRIGYAIFYRIFKKLSYLDIPLDAGDFCLLDRKAICAIGSFSEADCYVRGLRAWTGYKQIGVEYTRDVRHKGKTSNSFLDNFRWAKKAILNFSYRPLEWISMLAIATVALFLLAIGVYIYLYFITPNIPRGIQTIIILVLFVGSVQLLCLSIIGEYLAKIFQEVKKRPAYIISEIINDYDSGHTAAVGSGQAKFYDGRLNAPC